jgi:hypothetical protein
MNTVTIEHVPVTDLPSAWQAKLHATSATRVTVRIEEETNPEAVISLADNPLFGMWRDHAEVEDVAAHVRKLRSPRDLAGDVKSTR